MKLRTAAIALVAVLWALLQQTLPSSAQARKLAFVVGIDKYEKLPELKKAVNDARAMNATLKDLGFETTLVLDAQADRLTFFGAWGRFLESVKPGDTVAITFSGHGLQLKGINYLLPSDVPSATQGEEVVRAWSISMNDIADALTLRKPSVALFVIDACRDNPFAAPDGKKSFGAQAGLAELRVTQGDGIFAMYSAGANEQALDWLTLDEPNPNSVYTRRLLPLLRTPGLSLLDIAKRVQAEVAEDARNLHFVNGRHVRHVQRPAYYDGIVGQYYLAGLPPGTTLGQERKTPAATPQPPLSAAAREWQDVKDTRNASVLKAFRERHRTDAVYVALADEAIAKLEAASAVPAVPKPPAIDTAELARRAREVELQKQAVDAAMARLEAEAAAAKLAEERRRLLEAQRSAALTPPPVSKPAPSYHYVWDTRPPDDWLALRSEPSARSGRQLARLSNGTLIDVQSKRSDGWWYVRVVDTDEEGWVLNRYGSRVWVYCCRSN